jgi:DNA-binding CsgD family transcriptional regulator
MTVSMQPLVGRERELARLARLVGGIHEHGGALLIRGEAGVGKSAVLAAASEQAAEHGVGVVRSTGVASEAHLPFAALHELALPFLDRLDRLPALQRHALEMALGLAPREEAPDAFLVGLATLGLVAEAAAERPLLFVVEDAQWIDRSSGMVFGFVARRLEMEPVLMWFALRAGVPSDADGAGLHELELEGLGEEASAHLLDLHAPGLTGELRRRILDQAAGNPLALIELPIAAGPALPPTSAPLPLTATLERAFAARLDDLDADARALLLVAALEDAEPAELLRAAERIRGAAVDPHEWDAVLDAGLGELASHGFRFRHPLVRSAVEQASGIDERRAAHAALADVLDDPDRVAWHGAEAATGEDEAVASALAATAERAEARGAGDAASAAFERSADLTPDPALRALRLWRAGDLAWDLGRWQECSRLFEEAQRLGLPAFEDAAAAFVLEAFTGTMSSNAATVESFADVAEELLAEGDEQKAIRALSTVAVRAYWGELPEETRSRASAVARSVDVPASHPQRLCFLANVDPIRNGREVMRRLRTLAPGGITGAEDLFAVGHAAAAVWADDLSVPYFHAAGSQFRSRGQLGWLGHTLAFEAWTHLHRGGALQALTTAAESVRLAAETAQALYVPAAKLAEAVAVAQRGQDDTAQALISESESILLPLGATPLLSLVALAKGRAELAAGRPADAYQRLVRLFDRDDTTFHTFLRGAAVADLAEAAKAGDGDLELVRRHLAEWAEIAGDTGATHLAVQVSYAVAVLAEDDEAERLFQAAIASAATEWPFYAARARFAYGVWLRRRQRRAVDARPLLREAAETFGALGQETYAERALNELRASGETARRRLPGAWADLTPQELQIAHLAAEGLSNKEIGERLYLSHRTVGTHLYHLFPKLGVTSRAQLRDALEPGGVS